MIFAPKSKTIPYRSNIRILLVHLLYRIRGYARCVIRALFVVVPPHQNDETQRTAILSTLSGIDQPSAGTSDVRPDYQEPPLFRYSAPLGIVCVAINARACAKPDAALSLKSAQRPAKRIKHVPGKAADMPK